MSGRCGAEAEPVTEGCEEALADLGSLLPGDVQVGAAAQPVGDRERLAGGEQSEGQ